MKYTDGQKITINNLTGIHDINLYRNNQSYGVLQIGDKVVIKIEPHPIFPTEYIYLLLPENNMSIESTYFCESELDIITKEVMSEIKKLMKDKQLTESELMECLTWYFRDKK